MGFLLSIGLGFLKKYWMYILIAVFIGGFYLHYRHMQSEIKSQQETIAQQKATIETLTNQISQCQAANSKFQGAIDDANKAAQEVFDLSKKQQAQLASLKAQITKERTAKQSAISDLEDLKKHPLAATCADAIKELIDAPKEFTPLNGVPQ